METKKIIQCDDCNNIHITLNNFKRHINTKKHIQNSTVKNNESRKLKE